MGASPSAKKLHPALKTISGPDSCDKEEARNNDNGGGGSAALHTTSNDANDDDIDDIEENQQSLQMFEIWTLADERKINSTWPWVLAGFGCIAAFASVSLLARVRRRSWMALRGRS